MNTFKINTTYEARTAKTVTTAKGKRFRVSEYNGVERDIIHLKQTRPAPTNPATNNDVAFIEHNGVTHIVDFDRGDLHPAEAERRAYQKDAELAASGWRS